MRSSLRRLSNGRTAGGISLAEKLDTNRSHNSGLTDPTERSISSSVCLSESGQAVVVTTRVKNKATPLSPSNPFAPQRHEGIQQSPIAPKKPQSNRRRSFFGSSTSHVSTDLTVDCDPETVSKPKSQRRRSMIGTSSPSMVDSHDVTSPPIEQSKQTKQSQYKYQEDFHPQKPKSQPRRRSLFGLTSTNHEVDGSEEIEVKPSRAVRRSSGVGTTTIASSSQTASVPDGSFPPVDDGSTSHKPPRSNAREKSIPTRSSHDESSTQQDLDAKSPKKPQSRQRFISLTGSRVPTGVDGVPDAPMKPRSHRRYGVLGGSSQETKPKSCNMTIESTKNITVVMTNPYDLINKERSRRSLHPFLRNMLLDSIAKDISLQLAMSGGKKCSPTEYYGNVGKGVDLITIHKKMMAQGGTEKANIVSSHFYEVGIGLSRSSDGQIYICQLFK